MTPPQIEGMLCGLHTDSPSVPRLQCVGGGGGGPGRGVIAVEPSDRSGYFILSIGTRKWKCQSGPENKWI